MEETPNKRKSAEFEEMPESQRIGQPEPELIDATDPQHILSYADRKEIDDWVLGNQSSKTMEECIKIKLDEFIASKGREPTAMETSLIRQRTYAFDGWLETLKKEVEGLTVVPIDKFNKLVHDFERTIDYVAIDKVASTAEVSQRETKVARREDAIKAQNGAGVEQCGRTIETQKVEITGLKIKIQGLERDARNHDHELTEALGGEKQRANQLKQQVEQLKQRLAEAKEDTSKANDEAYRARTKAAEYSQNAFDMERRLASLRGLINWSIDNFQRWTEIVHNDGALDTALLSIAPCDPSGTLFADPSDIEGEGESEDAGDGEG